MLSYVPTHFILERLNLASDHTFAFELVKYELLENEVIVTGRLTLDGVIKMDVGSASITRDSAGVEVSVGDDVKAGVSDCIKRCARLFGCGVQHWNDTAVATPPHARATHPRVDDRLTSRQLGALQGACRRRGWPSDRLSALVDERYGKPRAELLTRSEASTLLSELAGANGADASNGH
jgi:hypothetical protein